MHINLIIALTTLITFSAQNPPTVFEDRAAFTAAATNLTTLDFEEQAPQAKQPVKMLDAAPRVALDPELGLCGIGRTTKDAGIAG